METARSTTVCADENAATAFVDPFVRQMAGHTLAYIEREVILHTLKTLGGNRTRAASILGISVRCLRDKLRNYRAQGVFVPESNPTNRD
jgi:DNA-binding NtrC family response regulator